MGMNVQQITTLAKRISHGWFNEVAYLVADG